MDKIVLSKWVQEIDLLQFFENEFAEIIVIIENCVYYFIDWVNYFEKQFFGVEIHPRIVIWIHCRNLLSSNHAIYQCRHHMNNENYEFINST